MAPLLPVHQALQQKACLSEIVQFRRRPQTVLKVGEVVLGCQQGGKSPWSLCAPGGIEWTLGIPVLAGLAGSVDAGMDTTRLKSF